MLLRLRTTVMKVKLQKIPSGFPLASINTSKTQDKVKATNTPALLSRMKQDESVIKNKHDTQA